MSSTPAIPPSEPREEYKPVNSAPAHGQLIEHEGKKYRTVKEGRAYILIPPDAPLETDPKTNKDGTILASSVFYNPIQQYNRDLSVLAIRTFGQDFLAKKRRELDHKAKRRAEQTERKKKRAEAKALEDAERCVKRRRVELSDNVENEPTLEARKDRPQNAETTAKVANATNGAKAADELEIDELPDDDLIACESSIPTTGSQNGSHPTAETVAKDQAASRPPKFEILDALSASGLRALRYAQELPFVTSVTANDLSSKAVHSIKLNIKHNNLGDKIRTETGNANAHMYKAVAQEGVGGPENAQRQYEVIDLDPYGSAVPFLDAAVQAVVDGGLLCVTCTDTSVFNSLGWPEKTFSLYGGLPIKGDHYAEGGLRLILHAIATAAAKYGLAIEPLLSLSIDYYARVFVRIRKSPAEVKFHAGKTMLVYNCDAGCGAWQTQPLARHSLQQGKKGSTHWKHSLAQGPAASPTCPHCGFKTHVCGPMYAGPIHNPDFIECILSSLPDLDEKTYSTVDRIEGMLVTALEETDLYDEKPRKSDTKSDTELTEFARLDPSLVDGHPFYFKPSSLAKVIHCQAPSDAQLRGALLHGGYRVVRSHTKPGTMKSDAPWSTLWRIMTEWVRQHAPLRKGTLNERMAGYHVLQSTGYFKQTDPAAEAGGREDSAALGKAIANGQAGSDDTLMEAATIETVKAGSGESGFVFDEKLGRDKTSKRLVRYQINPRANWGPMTRAK